LFEVGFKGMKLRIKLSKAPHLQSVPVRNSGFLNYFEW